MSSKTTHQRLLARERLEERATATKPSSAPGHDLGQADRLGHALGDELRSLLAPESVANLRERFVGRVGVLDGRPLPLTASSSGQ